MLKKILVKITLLLIFIIIMLAVYTQTAHFRSLVVTVITNQAENYLDAKIEIGELRGNFINSLRFLEISINDDENNILYLQELEITYKLPDLLKKSLNISNLTLNNLDINLREVEGEWNIKRMLPDSSEEEIAPADTSPDWKLKLHDFNIVDGRVSINTDYKTVNDSKNNNFIPSDLENINIKLALSHNMLSNHSRINLQHLSFLANWEDHEGHVEHLVNVKNIGLAAEYIAGESLRIDKFRLNTESISLTGSLDHINQNLDNPESKYSGIIELDVQNLKDFSYFFPEIDEQQAFSISCLIEGDPTDIQTDLKMAFEENEPNLFELQLFFKDPPYLTSADDPMYDLRLRFKDFNPFVILKDDQYSVPVNGDLNVLGNTLDYDKGEITVHLDLQKTNITVPPSLISNSEVSNGVLNMNWLMFDAQIIDGSVSTNLDFSLDEYGRVDCDVYIDKLSHFLEKNNPLFKTDYGVYCRLREINLGKFMNDSLLQSNMNLNVAFANDTYRSKERSDFSIESLSSRLADIEIDNFLVTGNVQPHAVNIDTLDLQVKNNHLQLRGLISDTLKNNLNYRLELPNISPLVSTFTEMEDLSARGEITGTIYGKLDSLAVQGDIYLADVLYEDYGFGQLQTSYLLYGDFKQIKSDFHVQARNITFNDQKMDFINFSSTAEAISQNKADNDDTSAEKPMIPFHPSTISQAKITGDISLQTQVEENRLIETGLDFIYEKESIELGMDLLVRLDDMEWSTEGKENRFIYKDDTLTVRDFIISSDDQYIMMEGILQFDEDGVNDFNLSLDNINLVPLTLLLETDDIKSGHLFFDLSLTGTSNNPIIESNLNLSELTMQEIENIQLTGNFLYPSDESNIEKQGQKSTIDRFPHLSASVDLSHAERKLTELSCLLPVMISIPLPNSSNSDVDLPQPNDKFHQEKNNSNPFTLIADENTYFSASTDSLNLDILSPLTDQISQIQGFLSFEIEIMHSLMAIRDYISDFTGTNNTQETKNKGTPNLNDPILNDETYVRGNVNVSEGGFRVPELGTRYSDISIDISATNNRVNFNKFAVKSGNGSLSLNGHFIVPDNNQDDTETLSVSVRSNNFPLINNNALDILINTEFDLTGQWEAPRFNGNILVPRGRINIDELLQVETTTTGDKPLLLDAQKKNIETPSNDELLQPSHYSDEKDALNNSEEPLDNLNQSDLSLFPQEESSNNKSPEGLSINFWPASRGNLNLSFPRNVWVRGSDINVELSADLQMVKRDVHFELFGTVNTVRGYYVFYGRRFQIESGEISFTGGREINPHISVRAEYVFRGVDASRKELELIVSGSMEDLDIAFELNNQPVEEVDAISYIMFGRSFQELTQGEKREASSQVMVVGSLIADRLADIMTETVGEALRVDFLEFRSDTASSQIGIEVGRYFSDNLFVSFKRNFNLSDSKEPVTEELSIEYEIMPYLYLLGTKSDDRTTGADLLWRLKWK